MIVVEQHASDSVMYQKTRGEFEEMSIHRHHHQVHNDHEQQHLSVDPVNDLQPHQISHSHMKQHFHHHEDNNGALYLDSLPVPTSNPLILSHPQFEPLYQPSEYFFSNSALDPFSTPNPTSSFNSGCVFNCNNFSLPNQYVTNDPSTECQPDLSLDNFMGSCLSSRLSSTSSSDLGQSNDPLEQLHNFYQPHPSAEESPKRMRSWSEEQIGDSCLYPRSKSLALYPNQTGGARKRVKVRNETTGQEREEDLVRVKPDPEQEAPKFLAIFELPAQNSHPKLPATPVKPRESGKETVRSGNNGGRYRRIAPANRKCDYCGAKFTRKDRLKYHVESSHLRLEPGFKCDQNGCGRAFRQKSDLVRHLRHVHHQL